MTQLRSHNPIDKYRHFSKLTLELALEVPSPLADQTTSRIVAELGECEKLCLRRGSTLACGVVSSSWGCFWLVIWRVWSGASAYLEGVVKVKCLPIEGSRVMAWW